MKKLTNTSKAKRSLKGIGKLLPGDSTKINDVLAAQLKDTEGWKVEDIAGTKSSKLDFLKDGKSLKKEDK